MNKKAVNRIPVSHLTSRFYSEIFLVPKNSRWSTNLVFNQQYLHPPPICKMVLQDLWIVVQPGDRLAPHPHTQRSSTEQHEDEDTDGDTACLFTKTNIPPVEEPAWSSALAMAPPDAFNKEESGSLQTTRHSDKLGSAHGLHGHECLINLHGHVHWVKMVKISPHALCEPWNSMLTEPSHSGRIGRDCSYQPTWTEGFSSYDVSPLQHPDQWHIKMLLGYGLVFSQSPPIWCVNRGCGWLSPSRIFYCDPGLSEYGLPKTSQTMTMEPVDCIQIFPLHQLVRLQTLHAFTMSVVILNGQVNY